MSERKNIPSREVRGILNPDRDVPEEEEVKDFEHKYKTLTAAAWLAKVDVDLEEVADIKLDHVENHLLLAVVNLREACMSLAMEVAVLKGKVECEF